MKKIIRLTESDMTRLVTKVIKEQQRATGWKEEGEGGNTQRATGWKEQGEGGKANIPEMTFDQFLIDQNWGKSTTPGDYFAIQNGFSGAQIIFGKGGKKVKVKL